ncbi:MAG: T9SS type A sorting domain-containing protein, partial [Bacteroidetes bacterium]|nr:T9SS type A sorting domain-containing protein [Bacteroidota bacterium]
FLAKYSWGSGVLLWAKSLGNGTLDDDGGKGLVSYAFGGDVYVCGSFAGSCDFDPGIPGGVLTSAGGNDGFIASYSSSGVYQWASRIGGPLNDEVNDIDMDRFGNLSITGTVFGNVTYTGGGSFTTNAGSQDAFVAQLTDLGTFNWVHPLGGPGANDEGYTVAMTPCGEVFVGGKFCSTSDFDPGTGVANLTGPACGFPNPDYSYFLASYDENGNYNWARSGSSTGGDSEIWGIALDHCNSLVATGGYSQAQDFDITSGTYNLFPAGGTDAFVTKHFLPKIIVTFTNRGYLERAVNCANVHIGRDTIAFCIPGNAPHTFDMYNFGVLDNTGPLPYITDDYTIIDGTTQPGWSLGDLVLEGTNLPGTAYGFRFDYADHGEVLGFSVTNFPTHGIYAFNADYTAVRDCHIGGNTQDGVRFFNSSYGTVEGSIIGLNTQANSSQSNGRDGIATNGTADFTQIGGTNISETNIIAGNSRYGIHLRSDNNQVEGNYIGTNSLSNYGNGSHGINIAGSLNRIGGTNSNEKNDIAFNNGYGITIENSTGYIQNHFWHNEYYCNAQAAIEITSANQGILPPVISLATINNIYGTGVPGGTVEVYAPDSSGCPGASCQGRYYLGSVTVDGTGNWALAGSFNLGQQAVALQTDGNLNTSEFSTCALIQGPLDVRFIQLQGESFAGKVQLQWEYTELHERTEFLIERSDEATDWGIFGQVTAQEGSSQSELIDQNPVYGITYYRAGQWLENGDILYSNIIEIQTQAEPSVQIFPNPASDFFQIKTVERVDKLSIFNLTGNEVLVKEKVEPREKMDIRHFPEGIYVVRLHTGGTISSSKLIINHQ